MTGADWIRLGVYLIAVVLTSGIVSVLLHYRAQNAKTKAEAAKITAETRAIGVDDQSQIIADLRAELTRLTERVSALETKNERVEHRNGELRHALTSLSHWVARVWSGLTEQQRNQVGPPPDTDRILNT